MTAHTIATEWVKIDGADRLRVKIDLEHDFATLYLHPETAESLRVALTAIPERVASAAPSTCGAQRHFSDLGYPTESA